MSFDFLFWNEDFEYISFFPALKTPAVFHGQVRSLERARVRLKRLEIFLHFALFISELEFTQV